jgi:hypothetical protein
MALIDPFYEWLKRAPGPDPDELLTAALELAEPEYAERILRVLLARGTEEAAAGLVSYYERLPDDVRAALHADPERLRQGIARALRGSAAQRLAALHACRNDLSSQVAYLLAAAIRDTSPKVRELAAQVLHDTASRFLESSEPCLPEGRAAERTQLAQALDEALRTFDLHFRTDVLEACVWFARELRAPLWSQIDNRRSRVGPVIRDHLASWRKPGMAAFLLTALLHREWQGAALRRLAELSGVSSVTALLRESALLDDPELYRRIRAIRRPRWLFGLDEELTSLPDALRPLLPRWICASGMPAEDKVATLAQWTRSQQEPLRRAALYALAAIPHPKALEVVSEMSAGSSPLARFARWVLAGRSAHTSESQRPEQNSAAEPPRRPGSASPSLAPLWQRCRRTPLRQRGPILAEIRAHALAWRVQIATLLRSPDPQDRTLALQVIADAALLPHFAAELKERAGDPIHGIRRLADHLRRAATDRGGEDVNAAPVESALARTADGNPAASGKE